MPEIKCKHQILFLSLKNKPIYCQKSHNLPFFHICSGVELVLGEASEAFLEAKGFGCDYNKPMEKIFLLLV